MIEGTSDREAERPKPGGPDDLAPGGARAAARGGRGWGGGHAADPAGTVEDPCVDPRCPMHAAPDGA